MEKTIRYWMFQPSLQNSRCGALHPARTGIFELEDLNLKLGMELGISLLFRVVGPAVPLTHGLRVSNPRSIIKTPERAQLHSL
jgi:hypothetical protein